MVIGTVTVPEDGCSGLLQEFEELVGDAVEDDCSGLLQEFNEMMGDAAAVESPEPGSAFKAVRVKGAAQSRAPVPFSLQLPAAATTTADAPTTVPMTVRKQKCPTQRPAGSRPSRRLQARCLPCSWMRSQGHHTCKSHPTHPPHPPTVL